MTGIAMLLMLLAPGRMFTVDARTETEYTVPVAREALRTFVDDIGLFQRHMPGVVAVRANGDGTYLYQTEKDIPLSAPMRTDFLIRKETSGDSLTVYASVDPDAMNYMRCSVRIAPVDSGSTSIRIQLQVRLSRENASEVHWLAPVLGESFISNQMTKDMQDMLREFVAGSNAELFQRLASTSGRQ